MKSSYESLKIATAQFENKSGDKEYNLNIIQKLTAKAAEKGAKVISFHECAVTGYTFARHLSRGQLFNIAEPIPDGESVHKLIQMAKEYNISILAGLLEREDAKIYNTYVCVNGNGLIAKFRKLHPFINPHITPGNQYIVFELEGWKCGILICYDNNIVENVRATALLGADIIFMPHVTMGTPSPMPGTKYVDKKLWDNREKDPVSLRLEFDGPTGKRWLMRWLPARAYDNGIYAVFSNPIGMDDNQLKNGYSLILDPYGEVIAECRSFDNEITVGVCTADKIEKSGGYSYKRARRPELYREIIGSRLNQF